jgi:hypothetical protein
VGRGASHLHHVAFSLLRTSWNHSSSGLPLSAFMTKVNFSLGVMMIGSIMSLRVVRIELMVASESEANLSPLFLAGNFS